MLNIEKYGKINSSMHPKAGALGRWELRLVLAWVELRKEELLANWKLAQNGELPFKIDPLK